MLILVLGGTRSGKSGVAESLAARLPGTVTYVATLLTDDADAELTARIDRHQARRPSTWTTVDATADLPDQLRRVAGTVLLDSLGPWVALHQPDDAAVAELCEVLRQRDGDTVIVSDEVGMAVHPPTPAGRAFQDAMGTANERLAKVADETLLVVAGRLLRTAAVDVDAILGGRA